MPQQDPAGRSGREAPGSGQIPAGVWLRPEGRAIHPAGGRFSGGCWGSRESGSGPRGRIPQVTESVTGVRCYIVHSGYPAGVEAQRDCLPQQDPAGRSGREAPGSGQIPAGVWLRPEGRAIHPAGGRFSGGCWGSRESGSGPRGRIPQVTESVTGVCCYIVHSGYPAALRPRGIVCLNRIRRVDLEGKTPGSGQIPGGVWLRPEGRAIHPAGGSFPGGR